MNAAAALAFAGGVAGALGLLEVARTIRPRASGAAPALAKLVDPVVRVGREGRAPGTAERRRLLLAVSGAAFATGAFVAGVAAGAGLAAAGPWALARLLRSRRERYRRAVDAGAAEAAAAIADAIGGGHSLRGALAEAAGSVGGAVGHELRRVAAELAAGAHTEGALDALRFRVRSHRIDVLVAACLLQRRAGGNLARLLRDSARAFKDQSRLEGEVRSATAQARFTGLLVVMLPLGGALLAELASPGFLAGLWGSLLTAWLVGIALVLQLAAAALIHRLGRVEW